MRITTIGIDLAKNIFHFHGVDKNGSIVLKKRLGRNKVLFDDGLGKLKCLLVRR